MRPSILDTMKRPIMRSSRMGEYANEVLKIIKVMNKESILYATTMMWMNDPNLLIIGWYRPQNRALKRKVDLNVYDMNKKVFWTKKYLMTHREKCKETIETIHAAKGKIYQVKWG